SRNQRGSSQPRLARWKPTSNGRLANTSPGAVSSTARPRTFWRDSSPDRMSTANMTASTAYSALLPVLVEAIATITVSSTYQRPTVVMRMPSGVGPRRRGHRGPRRRGDSGDAAGGAGADAGGHDGGWSGWVAAGRMFPVPTAGPARARSPPP